MIINSLLDLDFYKLTMGQLAYKVYPELKVEFSFKNRTKYKLGNIIPVGKIIEQINHIKTLSLKEDEITYLKSLNIFEDSYIDFLSNLNLPNVSVKNIDGELQIKSSGHWKEVLYWETFILSIINHLYYQEKYGKNIDKNNLFSLGRSRLKDKIEILKRERPNITEFGTRRRFSHQWQDYVIDQLQNFDFFSGTSNVFFAKKFNIKPIGTNAHEIYMISAGLGSFVSEQDLKSSHTKILNQWYDMYGYDLSIALSDTFGSNFFFDDFKEMAHKWKGIRQDSGDPFEFGKNVIKYYNDLNINPKDKVIIFSDGLDIDKIISLNDAFKDKINIGFGWGTNLTNDLGLETLSIVMKATKVISNEDTIINKDLVKLSDNINKAMGSVEEIEKYKRVFNYTNSYKEDLKV